jgi:FlaG/FlaF family flagellin (archaellin)
MSSHKTLKGVSPLVAVITLIGFTLIIAGFLANWATQLTYRQTQQIQQCLGAEVIIQSAIYDSGSDDLDLYINNRGDVDLTLGVLLTYENGSVSKPSGSWSADAGELITISISDVPGTLSEVSVESDECRAAQDFIGKSWINGL